MKPLLVILLVVMPQFTSVRRPDPQPPVALPLPATGESIVEVTVRRPNNSAAIPQVSVTLSGVTEPIQSVTQFKAVSRAEGMTDEQGRILFRNLAAGTYIVQARRDGYFSPVPNSYLQTSTVQVALAGVQLRQQVTLELVPGVIISGRVLDEQRNPIPNMIVAPYIRRYKCGSYSISAP